MQKRRAPISPKVAQGQHEKKKLAKKRFFFRSGLLFCLFVSLVFLIRIPQLQYTQVDVSKNFINRDMIQKKVEEYIHKPFLFVIPKTSKIFFPKNKIEKELLNEFPVLESVHISKNKNVIEIDGKERQIQSLWCGEIPDEVSFSNNHCFSVDARGFIYEESATFSNPLYFSYFTKLQGGTPIGQFVLPADVFDKVAEVKDILKKNTIVPKGVIIDENGTVTFLLAHSGIPHTGKVIFSLSGDLDKAISDFLLVIENDPLKRAISNPSLFEYIDMRYKDKVYHKFINQ